MTFEAELKKIKGIGKKTIDDIMRVYPTKDALVSAVSAGMTLPFDDDVSRALKEQFKQASKPVSNGVLVKSIVGEVVLFRSKNPHFRVTIGSVPVLVEKRVAEYLLSDGTGRIIKV